MLRLFVDEMVSKYDFDHDQLVSWLSDVQLRDDIIEAINRPKENLPWYQYRKLFVNDDRAKKGVQFWKANEEALFRAGSEFGVPPEIIVAILGIVNTLTVSITDRRRELGVLAAPEGVGQADRRDAEQQPLAVKRNIRVTSAVKGLRQPPRGPVRIDNQQPAAVAMPCASLPRPNGRRC